MRKVRASVKWAFWKICQNFAFMDFNKKLKILLQPIGKYFLVVTQTATLACMGLLQVHILI